MVFEEWLEKKHGPISEFSFENRGAMYTWIRGLREAFEAGWNGAVDEYEY